MIAKQFRVLGEDLKHAWQLYRKVIWDMGDFKTK